MISVFKAVALTTLLHASDKCVTHIIFDTGHVSIRVATVFFQIFIANIEVREKAEASSIVPVLSKLKLCWVGHVSRMENHFLPNIISCGKFASTQQQKSKEEEM